MAKKKKSTDKQPESSQGDQNIIKGNISGGIVVQGRKAKVSVNQQIGTQTKELSALFENLYKAVQSRPEDPNIDKEEIKETIQKIATEAEKQDQANRSKLKRWIEYLNNMAPDIIDVILASLGGPVTGVAAVLKKIALKSRQQTGENISD